MKSKNEIWLKALKEVTDLLETNNCRYILDTGTLLGAIREKGFIEWDNDIDISVIDCQDQESKILNVSKALYDLGYNVTSARDVIDVFDNTGILNLGVKFYDHVNGNYVSTLSKVQGRMFYNSLHNYLGNMVIYKNGYGKYYWKVIISNILKFSTL